MDEKQTIFDFLNSINEKKKIQINEKDFSPYMVSLWLSHSSDCISIVNEFNPYLFNMSPKSAYEFFYDKIPKKKRFIKFTKKEKSDESKNLLLLREKKNLSKKETKFFKDFF